MPLSDMAIRHARPTDKNYTIGDFDGLSLMVTTAGKKTMVVPFLLGGPASQNVLRQLPSSQSETST